MNLFSYTFYWQAVKNNYLNNPTRKIKKISKNDEKLKKMYYLAAY